MLRSKVTLWQNVVQQNGCQLSVWPVLALPWKKNSGNARIRTGEKETVLNVIQKEGKRFDADSIITRKETLCKKCFYAYEKFDEKREVGRIF